MADHFGAIAERAAPQVSLDELDLQRGKETLGHGVIPAIAPPAHTADDPMCAKTRW
jgi:hypothetical protein